MVKAVKINNLQSPGPTYVFKGSLETQDWKFRIKGNFQENITTGKMVQKADCEVSGIINVRRREATNARYSSQSPDEENQIAPLRYSFP